MVCLWIIFELLYCYDISLENFLKHTFLTFFSPSEAFGGSKGWVTGGGCIERFFCWTWLKHLDSRFGWKNTFLFTFKFWAKKQNSMAGSWMWLANFAIPVVRLQIWPCLLVKFVGKWSNGQNQTQSAVKDARRVLLAPKWWSCTNHLEGSWALMDLRPSLFFFSLLEIPWVRWFSHWNVGFDQSVSCPVPRQNSERRRRRCWQI